MAYDSVVVPEHWRSAIIVSLYKGKEKGQNEPIIEVLAC